MLVSIVVRKADITTLDVDAIVNAANESLAAGGGVCGAIFRAAGPGLQEACDAMAPCPTGEARITPGFALKARHVIHAVGPVWQGGARGEAEKLAACYESIFMLVEKHRLKSVALPPISTGIYGYPLTEATGIAMNVARRHDRPEIEILAAKRPIIVLICLKRACLKPILRYSTMKMADFGFLLPNLYQSTGTIFCS